MPKDVSAAIPKPILDVLAERSDLTLDDLVKLSDNLLLPAAIEQLSDFVRSLLRVNVDGALNVAAAGVLIAERLGDRRSLGLSLRSKANALWFKNELAEASKLFTAAIAHFEAAGLQDEVGRTLSSSIQALILMGAYDRALAAADRARKTFRELGDDRRLARVDINIANLYHRQDLFREALACYESAYRRLLDYNDSEGIGVALHNMSVCLIMLDDFQTALDTFREAQKVCEEHSMPLLALQADYNVCYLYFLRGEYSHALKLLRQVREKCRKSKDTYHEALCHLDESEILLELNLVRPAAQMAKDAARQFEKQNLRFEEARSLANLAIASHRLGDSADALGLFDRAKEIFSTEGNHASTALVALYQSIVLFQSGDLQDARSKCEAARAFFVSAGLERREALADLVLVRILLLRGEMNAAAALCRTTQRRLSRINAPVLRFQAFFLMGQIEQRLEKFEDAYKSYEDARTELETLRSYVQGDQLKVAFMDDKTSVYSNLVQICMRTERDSELAFTHMERAKSRALADLVTPQSFALVHSGQADSDEQLVLDEIRSDLNWYYHRLELEQNSKEDLARIRVRELSMKIEHRENEFLRKLRESDSPVSAVTGFGATQPVTLTEIRSFLGRDVTLIEYFQVEDSFIAAVISLDSIRIIPLAKVADVVESLHMIEFQIARMRVPGFAAGSTAERLTEQAAARLRSLYDQVFAPLAEHVKTEQCIIVPHGMLHYVPFHALACDNGYLTDRLSLSYSPSASIYTLCEQRTVNRSGPSLLMGVPDEMAPNIRQEIESIASVLSDAVVIVGEKATSEALRERGTNARVIHLATHGVARHDNPLFSTIRLADKYLTLYDFYRLQLPVQLITLSGCATGVSAVAAGDELQGLTRGLLSAGAASLIVTLWDVQDQTTCEFMSAFYRNLLVYHMKSDAMRETMLKFRRQYPHPFYWAPFTLIGSRAGLTD